MLLNGALPELDLSAGRLVFALTRGLFVAALFSGYGALGFLALVAPSAAGRLRGDARLALTVRLERLARIALILAIPAGLAWIALEAREFVDGADWPTVVATIPVVATYTSFGHVIALQSLAVAAAIATIGRGAGGVRRYGPFSLALAATALQAGHGHALAMEDGPGPLFASDVVHLLCAGAWLGGLIPLALFVRAAPTQAGYAAARAFSPLGVVCVAGMAISAAYQGWALIGGLPGLVGTAYGWTAIGKIALFAILLGFAALNRSRLTPALAGANPSAAKRRLLISIALETAAGLMIVALASFLTSLPPAIHEQPVWPFTVRPSLSALSEDPEFRTEVLGAAAMLGFAAALLTGAFVVGRLRWLAALIAIALAVLAVPHLDLLLVEAGPTSFYHSPTGFTAAAIDDGATLYGPRCASCHGPDGQGDGPAASTLKIPPADLTAGHLWAHSDGELFGWLSRGIESPIGGLAMPGFADALSDDQLWDLIDFVRAHNAGTTRAATGRWSPPIPAPGFQATCPDGAILSSDDLRGQIVRLIFAAPRAVRLPPWQYRGGVKVTPVIAHSAQDEAIPAGQCVVDDRGMARAYAIVTGLPEDALAGTQMLIDQNGWLRGVWRPDERDTRRNWNNPYALQPEIDWIVAHPIAGGSGGHHHH